MGGARGPLPQKTRRRRNAPTIPATELPVSGRQGPPPPVPSWIELGRSGRAWWKWAWSTPQAVAWGDDVGQEPVVARRASLEDTLATLEAVRGFDYDQFPEDVEFRVVKAVVYHLSSLVVGRLNVLKEMRELDNQLGLTPQGLARLRWTIVADRTEDEEIELAGTQEDADELAERRRRVMES